MNDASSHAATAYIAQQLAGGDAFLSEYYAFDLVLVPYWGATGALLALQQVVEPLLAFRLLMVLYALGLPLALLGLLRRDAPENIALFAVAAFAAFNWAYYLGEAPFILGQPLALLGFLLYLQLDEASEGRDSRRGLRLAGLIGVLVLTCFTHVFALVGVLAACGADALGRRLRLSMAQWMGGLAGIGLMGLAAWSIFAGHGTDANQGEWVFDLRPFRLGQVVTHPFRSPSGGLHTASLLFGAALVLLLVGPHVPRVLREGPRALREVVNPVFLWPALACLALAWVGPAGVQEAYGFEDIGERFTLLTLLLGVGAVRLSPAPAVRASLLVVLLGFGGLVGWDAWRVHQDYQPRAEQLDALLAQLPEECRLLPLQDEGEWDAVDTLYHRYANWAVIDRRCYGPHVFARTGQQPLRHLTRSDHRRVEERTITAEEWALYDHVLVQTTREAPAIEGLAEHAEPIGEAGGFRLYRVIR